MIPKGWTKTTIGQLCSFSSGHGFSMSDWSEQGLPIIRIQNLNGSRDFNYYVAKPEASWIVEPGELLFAWAGVKGVSFGPTIWSGPRGLLNQHIYRVRPAEGVDRQWLYLCLRLATRHIEWNAHGFKSNLVHVRQTDITGQVCLSPPKEEQVQIARVVECWDTSIRIIAALLEKKRKVKQGLMQVLLTGKRRFGRFTQDWKERAFGSFLAESRDLGTSGAEARKLTVRLYGKGVCQKEDTRPGSTATQYYRRYAGQFIYSKLDFLNGAFGIIPTHLDGYESTLDLPAFNVSNYVDPRWLLYYVTREGFYRSHIGLANGGRKARRVNPDDFLRLKAPMPDKPEQIRIADALETLDREIGLLGKQMNLIKEQKKGLMQKLLSGEVRVGGEQ